MAFSKVSVDSKTVAPQRGMHPHLVRLYGAVWSEGPDKLCIVLEYVENGSLLDVLKPGSAGTWESPRFGLAHGIAKCMRYLHHERPKAACETKRPN